jgi:hypothetical protein
MRLLILLLCWVVAHSAAAHHSYADYDRDERYELRGVLTDIHWANPHIVFTVSDGERDVRVEWITLTGAELTGVERDQFAVGTAVSIIGSRNRNPDLQIMTVIKEIRLPGSGWRWVSPSETNLPIATPR